MVSNNELRSGSLTQLSWEEGRELIQPLNPELVQVIDEVGPGKECKLYQATYPYGCEILRDGRFYLPVKGGFYPIDSPQVDSDLKKSLGYNLASNPVSMVLENSLELFSPQPDRTLPLGGLASPGSLFGLFRVLNRGKGSHQPKFTWSMTAGARSIFMLPKVAEREKFKRLKRTFNLMSEKPKLLRDHWSIFREIANHEAFSQSWETKLLFFSKEWFEYFDDPAWDRFFYFIYRYAWDRTDYWRNQFVWNLIFSIIQKETNMRSNLFVSDTIKCLFAIAVGGAPGFSPAIDNFAAPIKGLQQAYYDVYGLSNYLPVIMRPDNFRLFEPDPRPVYYSLQFPTAIEFGPKSSKHTSLLTDLNDIKTTFEKYLEALRSNQFNTAETPLHIAAQEVSFDFFHPNAEKYQEIYDTALLPEYDSNFLKTSVDDSSLLFPDASAFLKGCVRFAKKG